MDTVGPKGIGSGCPIQQTEASRRGMFYRAASDTKVAIHGKKAVKGYTKKGSEIGMDIQIADVKQTWRSVRRLREAGNRVVFDNGGSYVENRHTGEKAVLVQEEGSYVLSLSEERGPRHIAFQKQGARA